LHAQVDDRSDDAVRLWDEAAQAYPLDKIVLLHAGEARMEQYDPTGAIPFFERVLQLDPTQTLAIEKLLGAMIMEGTSRRHASWLEERAETSRNPFELRVVAWALLQAGNERLALETWRRVQELRGVRPSTPPMYTRYLILAGRAPEAEAAIRRNMAGLPANADLKTVTGANQLLAMALIGQGRFGEAAAAMGGPQDPPTEAVEVRSLAALAGGDAAGVHVAVEELDRAGMLESLPGAIGMMLVAAGSGDHATLMRLVEKVSAPPMRERMSGFDRAWVDPLVAWGRGSRTTSRQGFVALSSHGHVAARFWGHAFLGLLARDDGDCRLAAVELRKAWNGGIVYPADDRIAMQSVVLRNLALCHEKLGELDRAREWNDELLRRWSRADPDIPMLAEAKAMQARLAAVTPARK
jgi:tetratricopeptide (TPR) repeat protein